MKCECEQVQPYELPDGRILSLCSVCCRASYKKLVPDSPEKEAEAVKELMAMYDRMHGQLCPRHLEDYDLKQST